MPVIDEIVDRQFGRRQKLAREMSHQFSGNANPSAPMHLLDTLALGTMAMPVVGDIAGLAADARMFAQEPESRTPGNIFMAALSALPFVPPIGVVRKASGFQAAVRNPKTGEVVSGRPLHGMVWADIKKSGRDPDSFPDSGFLDDGGNYLTREEALRRLDDEIPGFGAKFKELAQKEEILTDEFRANPNKLEGNVQFDTLEALKKSSGK